MEWSIILSIPFNFQLFIIFTFSLVFIFSFFSYFLTFLHFLLFYTVSYFIFLLIYFKIMFFLSFIYIISFNYYIIFSIILKCTSIKCIIIATTVHSVRVAPPLPGIDINLIDIFPPLGFNFPNIPY